MVKIHQSSAAQVFLSFNFSIKGTISEELCCLPLFLIFTFNFSIVSYLTCIKSIFSVSSWGLKTIKWGNISIEFLKVSIINHVTVLEDI